MGLSPLGQQLVGVPWALGRVVRPGDPNGHEDAVAAQMSAAGAGWVGQDWPNETTAASRPVRVVVWPR